MKWKGEIKDFVVHGDIHGDFMRIKAFTEEYSVENYALIILGDAGLNFYRNKTDRRAKEFVQSLGCLVYLARGNHEESPENISTMLNGYDEIVDGYVYYEENYPNIRYFMDGSIYNLNGYSTLVIGGAYSVDKNYRLARAKANHEEGWDPLQHWTGWFKDEQLTLEEMFNIQSNVKDLSFDFVLTHTCPYSWRPINLFLNGINQSQVDNTMEKWMDTLKREITWKCAWLFGHFHEDNIIRPHVEMFMNRYETLQEIAKRWQNWDNGIRMPWGVTLNHTTYGFWNQDLAERKSFEYQSQFSKHRDPDIMDDEEEDWSDENFEI